MPLDVQRQAAAILLAYETALDLEGRAVILQDGKAGTVTSVVLSDEHGLRLKLAGHPGYWPVSTLKLVER